AGQDIRPCESAELKKRPASPPPSNSPATPDRFAAARRRKSNARSLLVVSMDHRVKPGGDEEAGSALLPLLLRRRDACLVEALRVHDIDLAHQDVGRDLVFGAAELAKRGQQSEGIECLDRDGQAQCPRLRAFFRSRHRSNASYYNPIIMPFELLAGESNRATLRFGEGSRSTATEAAPIELRRTGATPAAGLPSLRRDA